MKGIVRIVAVLAAAFVGLHFLSSIGPPPERSVETPVGKPVEKAIENSDVLANAYRDHSSGIHVSAQGIVVRTLPDDRNGDRHQRFILELPSGQTLLIAHNIDLAPRIASLKSGDSVRFKGEYEWNDQGGIIHWTHDDSNGSHEAGWLKHNGRTYQ